MVASLTDISISANCVFCLENWSWFYVLAVFWDPVIVEFLPKRTGFALTHFTDVQLWKQIPSAVRVPPRGKSY